MAKTSASRKVKKKSLHRWSGLFIVVAAVLVYALFAPYIRSFLGLEGEPRIPPKGESLRLATWNLHNFPSPEQDQERLQKTLERLDADIIAVQEIVDKNALTQLFPTWELYLSQRGGRGRQKLGVLINPETIEVLGTPQEHLEISFSGDLRPAYSLYVRGRQIPVDFHIVVVHLKARSNGFEIRQTQWNELAAILAALPQQEGPGQNDQDMVVLGDFNATGPSQGSAADELEQMQLILARQGLSHVENKEGCSVYWDGQRRDAWKEPSLLDMIWVAGFVHESLSPAYAFGHCARYRCQAFRSTEAYPELDYEAVSDHCPVVVDLQAGGSK